MITEDVACFPLSLSQEGMWLAAQLAPGVPAYNVPYLLDLRGPVRKKVLVLALAEIMQRHESLRTTFAWQNNEVVQVVADHLPLPYQERDFSEAADPWSAAQAFIYDKARVHFDLATGPLINIWLLRLGEEHHQLLFVLHHLICDGWSMDVLLRELSAIYTLSSETQIHHLPPLPIQYADFAVWQRAWLQGAVRGKRIAFWKKALAQAPALLALPADHPRPPVQTLQGDSLVLELPLTHAQALLTLGQSEQCTLFMTLLSVFCAALYRFTGQSDLVIGNPMANRTRPETQQLIGLFTNMLPLRCQLSPDLPWRQLLKQTRTTLLESYTYQDLPFEELVKVIQPVRPAGASPCFQVAFSLQQREQEVLQLPGVQVKTIAVQNGTSKFDLTLHMQLTSEQFFATFLYNTDIFISATMQRLADHTRNVLEHILANPDAPLSALPLPSPGRAEEREAPQLVASGPVPADGASSASQAALEQLLLEIWQSVLGFAEIEIQDNFFDLGGYSLLMIQVQRRLQETLQVEIALTDLFRFPTIHTLALFLSDNFQEANDFSQRRERGRARGEALSQQLARRQRRRAQSGGSHD
ncbi:MAG TPA: condensation domain-containing protein [Ktedonobacteraceae bacterium]|nr:condensation domain-containing protein [Ktedonobacteraceae bacterium]